MKRTSNHRILAVATLTAAMALPVWAQDSKPAQPAQPATQPTQPAQPKPANPPSRLIVPDENKGKVIPYPVPAATLDPHQAPGLPGQPGTAQAMPEALVIAEKSFDWGAIADTDPVEHIIKFKNQTDKKIKINALASCGCTVTTMEKTDYVAGEEGKVTARFDPHGRGGNQTKTITFTVTEPQNTYATQAVTLTANVKALVAFDPPRLFSTDVDHRSGKVEKIVIKGRKAGFQITKAESTSEFVKIKLGEAHEGDDAGDKIVMVPVELVIGKDAPIGKFEASATFTTNDERTRPQTYFLGADVVGDTKVTPPQGIARVNTPNTTFTNELRIDSRTGTAFKVTGIDVEARKDMQVVADVKPGEGGKFYMITISGVTPPEQGMFTGYVTVTTESSGGKETLRIPFSAAVSQSMPAATSRTN